MKCEICHKAKAKRAIRNGEQELYVCEKCAEKSEREANCDDGEETEEAQIIAADNMPIDGHAALMELMHGVEQAMSELDQIERDFKGKTSHSSKRRGSGDRRKKELALEGIADEFCVRGMLHLEAMSQLGELSAAKESLRAIKVELVPLESNGIDDPGHFYQFQYGCPIATAKSALRDLVKREREARMLLAGQLHIVIEDIACRTLAIIKNCRLLNGEEEVDLLSQMLLAAKLDMLDGIDAGEIEQMLNDEDLNFDVMLDDQDEQDMKDAQRAELFNRRFANVYIAKGKAGGNGEER